MKRYLLLAVLPTALIGCASSGGPSLGTQVENLQMAEAAGALTWCKKNADGDQRAYAAGAEIAKRELNKQISKGLVTQNQAIARVNEVSNRGTYKGSPLDKKSCDNLAHEVQRYL